MTNAERRGSTLEDIINRVVESPHISFDDERAREVEIRRQQREIQNGVRFSQAPMVTSDGVSHDDPVEAAIAAQELRHNY